ncbi:MAG: porin [Chitinophagaceae bacterium]|nr:porin [Chitinophagaceae bacterium]
MRSLILLSFLLCLSADLFAQPDTTNKLSFFGYVEAYYVKEADSPPGNQRPAFLYNHNRHDQANINLALAKLFYAGRQFRFNAGIMLGTYPVYNLAGEPVVLNRVYELNAGIRLGVKKHIWLDGGIMASHIGFESALGKDGPTLSRSIVADNSPYYETGGRLSFQSDDKKIFLAVLALNGWQRIATKIDKGAFGTGVQVMITPNDQLTINYSNYVGNGTATKRLRHYHNIYTIFSPGEKWKIIAGLDAGFQKKESDDGQESWFSPVLITGYSISKKIKIATRAEYFHDENNVIITTLADLPFHTWGFSGNIDFTLLKNCLLRMEYRAFKSRYAIFEDNNGFSRYNKAIAFALVLWFDD